jgi:hypothetical protein
VAVDLGWPDPQQALGLHGVLNQPAGVVECPVQPHLKEPVNLARFFHVIFLAIEAAVDNNLYPVPQGDEQGGNCQCGKEVTVSGWFSR